MSDKNELTSWMDDQHLSLLIGNLVVEGITDEVKACAQAYLDHGARRNEFAQVIINAKEGQEKQTAREALRMILIDLDFVNVDEIVL